MWWYFYMLVFHFTTCTEKQQFWNQTLQWHQFVQFRMRSEIPLRIRTSLGGWQQRCFGLGCGLTGRVAGSIPSHGASSHVLSLSLCWFFRSFGFLSPSKHLHIRLPGQRTGGTSATVCFVPVWQTGTQGPSVLTCSNLKAGALTLAGRKCYSVNPIWSLALLCNCCLFIIIIFF